MHQTIPGMFLDAVRSGADRPAWHWEEGGRWVSETRSEGFAETSSACRALAERGVGPGTPVAILSRTRREWCGLDLAIQCLRGITVGIYPSLLAEQVAHQLVDSAARAVFVEDAEQAAKVATVRDRLPHLEHVVAIEPVDGVPHYRTLLGEPDPSWLVERIAEVQPDDVATFIYTSGTTGPPKGAVLTQGNLAAVAHATRGIPADLEGDRATVFLPLAHALQRIIAYRGLLEQVDAYFCSDLSRLPEVIGSVRPTVLTTVPRMLEKIETRAASRVDKAGPLARAVYAWAFRVGRRWSRLVEAHQPVPLRLAVQRRMADRLVYSRIKRRLGGCLRTIVCGGAPLDPELARWYHAMGIVVLEGWGMTESSAATTLNRTEDFRLGTVGRPLPGVELRLAEDGEVLVRGPGVFQGYHGNPRATERALRDGWLHTGDVGSIDADGYLRITDRKKEILITAGGKNIPPSTVEALVERSPYVGHAVVIGNGRPYLVAILSPDRESLDELAEARGWPPESLSDRLVRPEVGELFDQAVRQANARLARFEQVKRHEVVAVPFSVGTGELTPTLKVKRRVVDARYAEVIERLYADARPG